MGSMSAPCCPVIVFGSLCAIERFTTENCASPPLPRL